MHKDSFCALTKDKNKTAFVTSRLRIAVSVHVFAVLISTQVPWEATKGNQRTWTLTNHVGAIDKVFGSWPLPHSATATVDICEVKADGKSFSSFLSPSLRL